MNVSCTPHQRLHSLCCGFLLLRLAVLLLPICSADAANATWNGTVDSLWATPGNWSATPVPGAGDTATFDNAGGSTDVINLGAGITISTIVFDTENAAAYTIGD